MEDTIQARVSVVTSRGRKEGRKRTREECLDGGFDECSIDDGRFVATLIFSWTCIKRHCKISL